MYGQTITLSDSDLPYTCTAGSGGTCRMTCDQKEELKGGTISCGIASECYYYCEEKKCNKEEKESAGIIDASGANNFYVIVGTANAEECLNGATIYLPNNGNATFSTSGAVTKAFKGLNIISGPNTGRVEIIVNADALTEDPMKDMVLNVASAKELVITINGNQDIEDSEIYCPDYPPSTRYEGPLDAPCVIDLGNNGYLTGDNQIIVPNGWPKGVAFPSGISGDGGTWINCDGYVDDVNGGEDYWSYITAGASGDCYWTSDPTKAPTKSPTTTFTTISPSNEPSKSPTTEPTASPSDDPTKKPTQNPTTQVPTTTTMVDFDSVTQRSTSVNYDSDTVTASTATLSTTESPSSNPSQTPSDATSNPSNNPSPNPTPIPTTHPSIDPTKLPTTNPTPGPTRNPLVPGETHEPTSDPTPNPTPFPSTSAPTSVPTNALFTQSPTLIGDDEASDTDSNSTLAKTPGAADTVTQSPTAASFNINTIYAIIAVCVFCAIGCVPFMMYLRKRENKKGTIMSDQLPTDSPISCDSNPPEFNGYNNVRGVKQSIHSNRSDKDIVGLIDLQRDHNEHAIEAVNGIDTTPIGREGSIATENRKPSSQSNEIFLNRAKTNREAEGMGKKFGRINSGNTDASMIELMEQYLEINPDSKPQDVQHGVHDKNRKGQNKHKNKHRQLRISHPPNLKPVNSSSEYEEDDHSKLNHILVPKQSHLRVNYSRSLEKMNSVETNVTNESDLFDEYKEDEDEENHAISSINTPTPVIAPVTPPGPSSHGNDEDEMSSSSENNGVVTSGKTNIADIVMNVDENDHNTEEDEDDENGDSVMDDMVLSVKSSGTGGGVQLPQIRTKRGWL